MASPFSPLNTQNLPITLKWISILPFKDPKISHHFASSNFLKRIPFIFLRQELST